MQIPEQYNSKPLVAQWIYRAMDGAPLGVVGRYQHGIDSKKDIIPFFTPAGHGWQAGVIHTPRPLFGLDTLTKRSEDSPVLIVEGEKCASALQSLGYAALTSIGGSNAADKTDWATLDGCGTVCILPDNDAPGEHYAQDVYRLLSALPNTPIIKILRLLELQQGGDIVNWLQKAIPDWDGYAPIDSSWHTNIQLRLNKQLNNAEIMNLAVLAGCHSTDFDWKTPGKIKTRVPEVMALDAGFIPESYRDWLTDASHRMQTPVDFAAISAVIVTASVIGAGCAIRPKARDNWEIIPNLWGACIGRPSVVLKSPSMKEPMQLLERLQAKYREQYDQAEILAEFDEMANDAMLKDVKSQLLKTARGKGSDKVASPDDLEKCKEDYLSLKQAECEKPIRRLFKTNETSIQSMTVLQQENSRGLLTFRDELTGLLVKWDRDDGQDERAYFLEGWNGNGTYTDFKIGRGLTDAGNICISLLGGIQPDKLQRYLYHTMSGNNDGMMQRLQLAVYPDEPQQWENIDTQPNRKARESAFTIIENLAEMDFLTIGATQEEHDERPYFRFSNAAQLVFNEWLSELQQSIQGEETPLMAEHLGKYRSLMPSLALVFHLIECAADRQVGTVTEKAALLAVNWCVYLKTHAQRIYAMCESPEYAAAVKLSEKIKAAKLSNPFTLKEVYDKSWHSLKNKDEVQAACDILVDENWLHISRPKTTGKGRPPANEYHINPIFFMKTP